MWIWRIVTLLNQTQFSWVGPHPSSNFNLILTTQLWSFLTASCTVITLSGCKICQVLITAFVVVPFGQWVPSGQHFATTHAHQNTRWKLPDNAVRAGKKESPKFILRGTYSKSFELSRQYFFLKIFPSKPQMSTSWCDWRKSHQNN